MSTYGLVDEVLSGNSFFELLDSSVVSLVESDKGVEAIFELF